jgi:ubiquinone/menaquinone biosynthesis C-methylase UbiE
MSMDPQLRIRLVDHYQMPILEELAKHARGRLLDIGCGTKPLEATFRPYVTEHVGVDHEETLHDQSRIDLFGTAYALPVEDASFDTVLSTAVLEHLEDPAAALREARRVLKPGGVAIYSAPLFWNIHEAPRDFYRFTPYGFEHLFQQAGFRVEEVRPLAGFWMTWGQMAINYMWDRIHKRRYKWIVPPATRLAQAMIRRLDDQPKPDYRFAWAHAVRAVAV